MGFTKLGDEGEEELQKKGRERWAPNGQGTEGSAGREVAQQMTKNAVKEKRPQSRIQQNEPFSESLTKKKGLTNYPPGGETEKPGANPGDPREKWRIAQRPLKRFRGDQ